MPSVSYRRWRTFRTRALDEIAQAHVAVGGSARGRRYTMQQINHAYTVLLAAHFQGFCRDLHSECIDHVLALIAPTAPMLNYLRLELARGRQLDRGNAQPSSIGADFGRFGMRFWDDLKKIDHTSANWRNDLETLNVWRNAIVHQDFTSPSLGGIIGLQLRQVRQWRNSCRRLAMAMDEVVRQHMHGLTGSSPWLGGNMSKGNEKKPHYKPGDWVSFQWGIGDAIGQVLEDRGPIGVGGRRLYRIQPAIEYIDAFEIPEVDLKPAHHPVATKP